ncbi:MAG: tetratricopeptide repeat protein [Acidobacteriota bacterium]
MKGKKILKIHKKAEKYLKNAKYEKAINEYQKLLKENPYDYSTQILIADLSVKLNKIEEAKRIYFNLLEPYLKDGLFAKAIHIYKKLLKIDPENERIINSLADLYLRQAAISEAEKLYVELAEKYKHQNKIDKLIETYKKILFINKENIKIRLNLGKIYFEKEMTREGTEEYSFVVEKFIGEKKYTEAIELIENIFKKMPEHGRSAICLFEIYEKTKDKAKILPIFENLIEKEIKNLDSAKALLNIYIEEEDYEKTENLIRKTFDAGIFDEDLYLVLINILVKKNEIKRAFDLLIPAIDSEVNRGNTDKGVSLIRLILTYDAIYLPALEKLSEIYIKSNQGKNLISVYNTLSEIYEDKGMIKEAMSTLKKLIKLDPKNSYYKQKINELEKKQ